MEYYFEVYKAGAKIATLKTGPSSDFGFVALEGHDGLGSAPFGEAWEQGAQQDGESPVGYRYNSRTFRVLIKFFAESEAQFWTIREKFLKVFRASPELYTVRFIRPDGAIRAIDCKFAPTVPALASKERDGLSQRVILVFRAPVPAFYDPTAQVVTVQGFGGAGFPIPLVFPLTVGASTADRTFEVPYPGSWDEYPTIEIAGPITDPVVESLTVGKKLSFVGSSIAAGSKLIIDTRYNQKTVVDELGANKISLLSTDSDLSKIRIVPTDDGSPNLWKFTGSGVTSATFAAVRYFHRYDGI